MSIKLSNKKSLNNEIFSEFKRKKSKKVKYLYIRIIMSFAMLNISLYFLYLFSSLLFG